MNHSRRLPASLSNVCIRYPPHIIFEMGTRDRIKKSDKIIVERQLNIYQRGGANARSSIGPVLFALFSSITFYIF